MRKRGKKSKRPTKEKFYELYNNESLSVEEIANIFKVSINTIYNWSYQFNKENEEKLSDKQIIHREIITKKNKNIKDII